MIWPFKVLLSNIIYHLDMILPLLLCGPFYRFYYMLIHVSSFIYLFKYSFEIDYVLGFHKLILKISFNTLFYKHQYLFDSNNSLLFVIYSLFYRKDSK